MSRSLVQLLLFFAVIGSPWSVYGEAIARWQFDGEDAVPVQVRGAVSFEGAGPRGPEFPTFSESNRGAALDGGYLVVDGAPDTDFTFTNGDAITIEAWVKVDAVRSNSPVYIVGKGRTGSQGFAADNQNWALRLVGEGDLHHVSFLFASAPGSGSGHWHRWTSSHGFHGGTGWHHIAVRYRFGEPDTARGWIDGQPTAGSWDMGGATTAPPVRDGDAVWIGSALGGNRGSTFTGQLDDVTIHRAMLDDDVLRGRFLREGPPRLGEPIPAAMPDLGPIPRGVVRYSVIEGLASHTRWPYVGEEHSDRAIAWNGDTFLLGRLPLHYDGWGIRDGWDASVLVRMAADVMLPRGERTFLVRARALGRLWIDGQLVAETAALDEKPPDGEEAVTPLAEPPLPGVRIRGYRMQEVTGEAVVAPGDRGTVRVVFETIAGGPQLRTELGETLVAVMAADGTGYEILSGASGNGLPLTDGSVESFLARQERGLVQFDDARRRASAASMDEFWAKRHDLGRTWAGEHPVTAAPIYEAYDHPIDRYVQAKIDGALDAGAVGGDDGAARFYDDVYPVLQDACFRCHGDKDKGGLRLTDREAALAGGDSGAPAVVPGDAAGSTLIERITTADDSERMPPTGSPLEAGEIAALTAWIEAGAPWPGPPVSSEDVRTAPVVDDYGFVRRVYVDTIGVPPSSQDVERFVADSGTGKRRALIDSLLDDERYAGNWMGFWQDMLAENPTLINASLNSTGPFRWFVYDALRDNKALDRMVSELILMRGGTHEGGSAGFALAGENDAPFAAKGHIIASAFLGVEMQCARCHDAPYHASTQGDLFSLAAMIDRKPVTVPGSSAVPEEFFATLDREPLIQVTLAPGEPVEPVWPFGEMTGVREGDAIAALMMDPDDTRERLAALVTAPQNERFAQVMVNRLWQRLMGTGIVEPVHDWEGRKASHPELLAWLGRELVAHDYDVKHVLRLIMTSETYQRDGVGDNRGLADDRRFFTAPDARRLTAEQVVDALHAATGRPMEVETLTFVHDGRRPLNQRLTLGQPTRAWMFANLANERDRPSLNLPKAGSVADVLEAFGWTGARQQPVHGREMEANVLQPGVLANGTLTASLTRASADSPLAEWAVAADDPETLLEQLFLQFLGRRPATEEAGVFLAPLELGFDDRIVAAEERESVTPLPELPLVTWFNHLRSEANTIQLEWERRVRQGPAPDPRLRAVWREAYEDVIWSLVNHPEFVWIP